MPEFRSIRDLFRDPLMVALVLVGIVAVLAAVGGSLLSSQNSQGVSPTTPPSTQSLPADTKPQ